MAADTGTLAQQLMDDAFGPFFRWPAHDHTIEGVWRAVDGPSSLIALVEDAARPNRARFLAAEVLFARNPNFIEPDNRAALAEVYASALVHNETGSANAWGLLTINGQSGPVGRHLVGLGSAALPALKALLNDDSTPLEYEGSEDATIGNRYHFRLKDFAAFYISQIEHRPLQFTKDPAQRDAEINRLAASL